MFRDVIIGRLRTEHFIRKRIWRHSKCSTDSPRKAAKATREKVARCLFKN